MPQLNNDTMLRKWGPILDALKIEDDNKRLLIAQYAEWYLNKPYESREKPKDANRIVSSEVDPYGEEDWEPDNQLLNTKPIANTREDTIVYALRILSRVDTEGKNVTFENLPVNYRVSVKVDPLDLLYLSVHDSINHTVMEELSANINKQLESNNNLHLGLLMSDIVSSQGQVVASSSFIVD